MNEINTRCTTIKEHIIESISNPVSYTHLDVYKRQIASFGPRSQKN